MVEAVQTTASPVAIWVMCVVMTILAGVMVSGVLIADAQQARESRRDRRALEQGDVPTRADLPARPAAGGQHAMPAQRTGDADRAARSYAGPGTSDDAEGVEVRRPGTGD